MPDGSIVTGPGIGDGCSGCGEKARPPFVVRPPVSGPSNAMLISGADSVTWPLIGVDDRLVDDTPTRPAQPEPVVVREGAVRKNGRNQYPQANRPDTRPAGQGSQPEPVKPDWALRLEDRVAELERHARTGKWPRETEGA